MQVIDTGHKYLLTSFDGGNPIPLTFVKRDFPSTKYPGNVGITQALRCRKCYGR